MEELYDLESDPRFDTAEEMREKRIKRNAKGTSAGKVTDLGKAWIGAWWESALLIDAATTLDASDLDCLFRDDEASGFNCGFDVLYEVIYEKLVEYVEEMPDDGVKLPKRTATFPGNYPGLPLRLRDELDVKPFRPVSSPPPIEWLVESLLPLRGVNMFVSLPEAMKTWAALDLAVCVSQGKPWLGKYKTRQTKVLVVNFEMDPIELDRRLSILGADSRLDRVSFPKFNLSDEAFWTELRKTQAGLVVIDSLAAGSAAEFGELDSRIASPLRRAGRASAERTAERADHRFFVGYLFIHHSPKGASKKDVESLFRGSGAIRGAVDNAFYFEKLAGNAARISEAKWRVGEKPEPFIIEASPAGPLRLGNAKAEKKLPEDRILEAVMESTDGISASRLADLLEMSRRTVQNIIPKLIDDGKIIAEGKGRAARLMPANRIGTQ